MADVDELLAANPPQPETAVTVVSSDRRCRRHEWAYWQSLIDDPSLEGYVCIRCGRPQDPALSRRGKSARRLGHDQERRIERVYGPRKVGEYGDAIDLLGRDFAWQSKATRDAMPLWLAAVDEAELRDQAPTIVEHSVRAMLPVLGSRHPLVIQSWVRNGGLAEGRTRDRIWVGARHWSSLHGGAGPVGYWLVMSGEHFLSVHGRDEDFRGLHGSMGGEPDAA